MTLRRLLVLILLVWFVLVGLSFVFFSVGGSVPGDGRGDPLELRR
jgi:hypothetical protein